MGRVFELADSIDGQLKQFQRKFRMSPADYVEATRFGRIDLDEHALAWAVNLANLNVRS